MPLKESAHAALLPLWKAFFWVLTSQIANNFRCYSLFLSHLLPPRICYKDKYLPFFLYATWENSVYTFFLPYCIWKNHWSSQISCVFLYDVFSLLFYNFSEYEVMAKWWISNNLVIARWLEAGTFNVTSMQGFTFYKVASAIVYKTFTDI